MATLDLNSIKSALNDTKNEKCESGVDFSGKSIKLNTADDAKPIVDAINQCPHLHYLTLTGNTLGVEAAHAIAKALESHPELKLARWSDIFTGRMKTEIPPALAALGDGMIAAGARLRVLDLSDNAFGPIGVEGLAKLLQSEVCSELEELRLNNNGLGITGARLLAAALSHRPPRLRVFIAGRNRLENDGATALAGVFSKMGSLRELALPQNGIYHSGITALSRALGENPGLEVLNLNDNTVGARGADALAGTLPSLRQLKDINLGDCLLKSKGALALATAFRHEDLPIQRVELSHNEIGRAACAQVAAALAGRSTLARVVLAGNSLGGADMKREIRQQLGAAADLSDGDASDEEYVTGSSEEESGSDEDGSEAGSEDGEDAREHTLVDQQQLSTFSLDNSGVEEVPLEVARLLQQPSLERLRALGDAPDDVINAHLQVITDPSARVSAYVSAALAVSALAADAGAAACARSLYRALCACAAAQPGLQWGMANALLAGLRLIKSENKAEPTCSLAPCYSVLASVISEGYFPAALRDTLRFFISSKRLALRDLGLDVDQHPQLTHDGISNKDWNKQ